MRLVPRVWCKPAGIVSPHRHFRDPGVGIRMDPGAALKGPPLLGIEKEPPHVARFVRANNEPREGGQISDGQEDSPWNYRTLCDD